MKSRRAALFAALFFSLWACSSVGEDDVDKKPVEKSAQKKVTIENWQSHPEIRKIGKLVEEIKAEINSGGITVKRRVFDRQSPKCIGNPSLVSLELGRDKGGNIRFFGSTHMITMEVPGRLEYYYDELGQLRFILVSVGEGKYPDRDRVYFDAKGEVLISIAESDGNFTEREYSPKEAGLDLPVTHEIAGAIFLEEDSCPELRCEGRWWCP